MGVGRQQRLPQERSCFGIWWLRHGWQESEEPMRVAGGDINNRGGFEDTEFVVGGGDGG